MNDFSSISDVPSPDEAAAGVKASFHLLFEATPMPILVLDRQTLKFRAVNDAAMAFYGYSRAEFLTLTLPDIRPEKLQGEIEWMISRLDDPSLTDIPRLHLTKSGERRIVKVNARMFEFEGEACILAAVFDITKQHETERELRRVRSFLKNLVDRVPAAVFAKEADTGHYVFYNASAEALFGLSRDEVIGKPSGGVYGPEVAQAFVEQDHLARLAGPAGVVFEHVIPDVDGSTRHVRIRKVVITDGDADDRKFILGVAEDVTAERVREAQISHLASHDALTGLANRWMFQQHLDSLGARGERSPGAWLAIHYIDLDGFKAINDAWGHPVGDEILRQAAARMLAATRDGDIVARLGGDEFAVLQPSARGARQASAMADRIVSVVSVPYHVDGIVCEIGASVGVCLASPETAIEQVIEEADRALYAAKREGKRRSVLRCISDTDAAQPHRSGDFAQAAAASG